MLAFLLCQLYVVSVGEYRSYPSAKVVAQVLSAAEIPHRIASSTLPMEDSKCWIGVPPESVTEVQRVLARSRCSCAVPSLRPATGGRSVRPRADIGERRRARHPNASFLPLPSHILRPESQWRWT